MRGVKWQNQAFFTPGRPAGGPGIKILRYRGTKCVIIETVSDSFLCERGAAMDGQGSEKKNKPSILSLKDAMKSGGRRYCVNCGRPLPASRMKSLCEQCEADAIYKDVKEYVRDNDVNEYQVADHFDISVDVVRKWIREGYMSYKGEEKVAPLPGDKENLHISLKQQDEHQGWHSGK